MDISYDGLEDRYGNSESGMGHNGILVNGS